MNTGFKHSVFFFAAVSVVGGMPQLLLAEPMVVTASRSPVAVSESIVPVIVLTGDDLAKTGASTVAEALAQSAGVQITPSGGHSPSVEMQGFSAEHVLILINGQRVNGRVNGAIDLRRINTANIQQIEIVQGPSSALYGSDALGGVINIITSDDLFDSTVSTRINSQGSAEVAVQSGIQVSDRFSINAALIAAHTASYDLDDRQTGNNGPDNDRYAIDLNALWTFENFSIKGTAFHQYQDRLLESSTTGGGEVDLINLIEESRVSISPTTAFGELIVEGQLSYARYYDQYVQDVHNTSDGDADERTTDHLITVGMQASLPIGARHNLTAGVENHYEKLSSERLIDDSDRSRTGIYFQDRIDDFLIENLQVAIGGRFDGDTQFGGKATPKVNLSYRATQRLQLLAGAGKGYRAPDFKQLYLQFSNASAGYVVEGNPELVPEETESVNLGLGYQADRWDVRTNAYYHDVVNLIETIETTATTGRRFTYENVSSAQLIGIDSVFSVAVAEQLDLTIFYNYLDSENKQTGDPLSGRAEHRGGLSMNWQSDGNYRISGDLTRTGTRVFTHSLDGPDEADGSADGYTQFDLQWAYQGSVWRWAVGGKNLFNEGDTDLLTIEPRRAYIQLKRSF